MTTTAAEIQNPRLRDRFDVKLAQAIIPFLVISLLVMALLPEENARNMLVQLFVAQLLVLAAFDIVTMRVPNILIYPAIVFTLMGTGIVDASLLPLAILGGLACLGAMFALAVLGRGSMGMGDVKAACLIGCALGPMQGIFALILGFATGALTVVPLLFFGLRRRKDSVPLTPFLTGGTLAWMVLVGSLMTEGLAR